MHPPDGGRRATHPELPARTVDSPSATVPGSRGAPPILRSSAPLGCPLGPGLGYMPPARRAQRASRERIVKPARGHPVNNQFLDMFDAAGELNTRPRGHAAHSIAESSACPPRGFRRSGNGAGCADRSCPQIAHRGVLKTIHKAPFNSARYGFTAGCSSLRCKTRAWSIPGGKRNGNHSASAFEGQGEQ